MGRKRAGVTAMPVDLQMLVWIVIAIVLLFAVIIVSGLRMSTRMQDRALRETRAADVLAAAGISRTRLAELLYGVWQTNMTNVILHVRDGNDREIAVITRRLRGASITVDDEHYSVVLTSGWRERAVLVREGDSADASAALCTFELRGWGGRRIASYTLQDKSVFSIRAHWSLPWRRRPLEIMQDDRVAGQLFAIGGVASNVGRAVILPTTIPLSIRLFVLNLAIGSSAVASSGR